MKQYILAALCALFLFACGGSNDGSVTAPTKLRNDLYYGYYLTNPTQVGETINHVNLVWVGGVYSRDAALDLAEAKLPAMLDISYQVYVPRAGKFPVNPNAEADLKALFQRLSDAGLLKFVVALYPIDEPDITLDSSVDIVAVNKLIRAVAAEFPELVNVKLAVIYTGDRTTWPGIATYDWIGFDSYNEKSLIFTNGQYSRLLAAMRPDQRMMIVPGGAFGQDITPFFNWAETHSEVVAIVPFLWFDVDGRVGIKNRPNKIDYCKAGEMIKKPERGPVGSC